MITLEADSQATATRTQTRPAVTAPASSLRLAPTIQGPCQPPRSLSFRPLGGARFL